MLNLILIHVFVRIKFLIRTFQSAVIEYKWIVAFSSEKEKKIFQVFPLLGTHNLKSGSVAKSTTETKTGLLI